MISITGSEACTVTSDSSSSDSPSCMPSAVSSLWMVKPGAESFKREMLPAAAGLVFAVGLIVLG